MKYPLVDSNLIEHLEQHPREQGDWLFLEPHLEFEGVWGVECLDPHYYFDFKDMIGPYRVVSPFGLQKFLDLAKEKQYKVGFFEDPTKILDAYESLNEPPSVAINSKFEETVNGFLPFQVQGFNYLKDQPRAGVAMWSTGTGKTVLASALIKYHAELDNFDNAFFVVKTHNKVNTQRALKYLTGLDSVVLDGTVEKREKRYMEFMDVPAGIGILNYEKYRDDSEYFMWAYNDRRILNVWDEMPTKLKTRTTQLYKAVCRCLYDTHAPKVNIERQRPSWIVQYMLSATPIENSPSDFFNCVRLMDPTIYGTVSEFEAEYVAYYNWRNRDEPEGWHKLDKMGHVSAHITHQVDKDDPDIAKQFPEVIEDEVIVDWDPRDRKVYDRIAKAAKEDENIDTVAAITLLQMYCDAPSLLKNSAAVYEAYEGAVDEWIESGVGKEPKKKGSAAAYALIESLGLKLTDERHTKLLKLRELLGKFSDRKVVVFSALNEALMPTLERYFQEWGITYVRYNGTQKQKQAAEDAFKEDPDIQVFLSSDMGSDSLNLEVASVVINYDLPWKWSTKIQRQNRIHRVTSEFGTVLYIDLMMDSSVEDRRRIVIEKKWGYHKGVFKGEIAHRSASARMTKEDLEFVLGG